MSKKYQRACFYQVEMIRQKLGYRKRSMFQQGAVIARRLDLVVSIRVPWGDIFCNRLRLNSGGALLR
ncbi:hypothetical protein [Pseudomonas akapageensis]|uniref:hypothetical protein n=1 Tax=Pseudomonas akapageensis TaxID=2609961 RepID=UPI00140B6B6C|nr:hypothetical protein [Pseudomonas akapageensis]